MIDLLVCLMEIRPCNANDLGLDSYVMMVSAKAPTKEPIMLRFRVSSIPLGESYAHLLFVSTTVYEWKVVIAD